MSHRVYIPASESMAREMGKSLPKWERGPSLVEKAVQFFMSMPGAYQTADALILACEREYAKNGSPVFFPESAHLLDMLSQAKMDVEFHDFDMNCVSPCFSIAWPEGYSVNGIKLPSCLVAVLDPANGERVWREFMAKYCPSIRIPPFQPKPVLFVFRRDATSGYCYSTRVPDGFLRGVLKSSESMEALFDKAEKLLMEESLDSEETRTQYELVRMVVRMIVYMSACPGAVRPGFPQGRGEECYPTTRYSTGLSPSVVAGPDKDVAPHYRTWHFRSYPTKRDGTRKAGMVFVHACMVNMDIDPATVAAKQEAKS